LIWLVGSAGLGAKGSLQSGHAAFDLDTQFAERGGEQSGRETLLELQFGMSMDLAAEADRLVLEIVYRTADLVMNGHRNLLGNSWRPPALVTTTGNSPLRICTRHPTRARARR